jgi:formate-dependent phosphoribosylglycinamide formyltransferase (GAR transformylase)
VEEWATLKLDLLGKTELRIENVELRNVDLNEFATVVAGVLGLASEEVMVTNFNASRNSKASLLARTHQFIPRAFSDS